MEGTPPGDALQPPAQRATPARKGARCGAGAGSTRPHRPHPGHTGRGTLAARSRGRAVGGGTAPDTRRPSQRRKAPPPGTPFRHPHSEQRLPAGAHAVGPVLGPHARIDRTRDTRDAGPWLPAPGDGRPGAAAPTTPSQVGGNRDRTAPPQSTPDGARDRGRTRGGARTSWNGPTSAQCRDHARCARHTTQRGADTARARAHTHEKDTRGLPEGQPDRARGTHRPHGMAYQRARVRDTRTGRPATRSAEHAGREGGNRRDTTPGTGPNPPRTGRERRAHTDGTLHPPRQ